jgi:hypothetical protein
MEEQIFSQKSSQLSTIDVYLDDSYQEHKGDDHSSTHCHRKHPLSTPSTPDVVSKKLRPVSNDEVNIENQNNNLPDYLQSTNPFFEQLFIGYLMNTIAPTNIEAEYLRQLAILKHKIADIYFQKQLWNIYLQSGTGQWNIDKESSCFSCTSVIDRRIWPMHVKKMIPSSHDKHSLDDEHQLCEKIVYRYIDKLNTTMEQYQTEIDQKKKSLLESTNHDDTLQKIDVFVRQHGVRPLQMKFKHRITTLKCNYEGELLKRAFVQLQPTDDQVEQNDNNGLCP